MADFKVPNPYSPEEVRRAFGALRRLVLTGWDPSVPGGTTHQELDGAGVLTHATIDALLDALPTTYFRIDTSNGPLTGDVEILKTAPKFTLTGSSSGSVFLKRVAADEEVTLVNVLPSGTNYVNQVPAMTSETTPSGVASDSGHFTGREGWTAFDRASGSYFALASSYPQWIKYEFPSTEIITSYSIESEVVDPVFSRTPTEFKLQGSNDDSIWVDLDSQTGIVWGSGETKRWSFANATNYLYYRLYVTDTLYNNQTLITELTLDTSEATYIEVPVLSSKTGTGADVGETTLGGPASKTVVKGTAVVVESTLTVEGGNVRASAVKTADYTALASDSTVVADGTANTVTLTLPLAPAAGQVLNLACLDSTFAVDIDFNGKLFYDSASNERLIKGENLTVQYTGSVWVGY
jgi:hypothetical protein